MLKKYDGRYYAKWYRSTQRATLAADLRRQVAFAVAVTEQLLGRSLASVLDLAAGEGRWQPVIHRLRPRARYAGIDSSEWAVRRWGARRNIRLGNLERLDESGVTGEYDLIVAADVLHYLATPELRLAVEGMLPHIGGVAYLPTFTNADTFAGDRAGFQDRPPSAYREVFTTAGLLPLGMHVWTTRTGWDTLSSLERPE